MYTKHTPQVFHYVLYNEGILLRQPKSSTTVPETSLSTPMLNLLLSTVGWRCAVTAASATMLAPSPLPKKGFSSLAAAPTTPPGGMAPSVVGVESAWGLGERDADRMPFGRAQAPTR